MNPISSSVQTSSVSNRWGAMSGPNHADEKNGENVIDILQIEDGLFESEWDKGFPRPCPASIKRNAISPDGTWLISYGSSRHVGFESRDQSVVNKRLGETVKNGWMVASPDSKWVIWKNTKDIAYTNAESINDESVEPISIEWNWYKKSAFSSKYSLLMLSRLYKEDLKRQLEEFQKAMRDLVTERDEASYARWEAQQELNKLGINLMIGGGVISTVGIVAGAIFAPWAIGGAIFCGNFFSGLVGPGTIAAQDIFRASGMNSIVRIDQLDKIQEEIRALALKIKNQEELIKQEKTLWTLSVKLFSANSQKPKIDKIIKFNIEEKLTSITYSENSKYLLTVEDQKTIKKWPTESGENIPVGEVIYPDTLAEKSKAGPDSITEVVPSFNGKWLALAKIDEECIEDTQIWLYAPNEKRIEFNFKVAPSQSKVLNLAFSPNGKWLAALKAANQLQVFSIESSPKLINDESLPVTISTIRWQEERLLALEADSSSWHEWGLGLGGGAFKRQSVVAI